MNPIQHAIRPPAVARLQPGPRPRPLAAPPPRFGMCVGGSWIAHGIDLLVKLVKTLLKWASEEDSHGPPSTFGHREGETLVKSLFGDTLKPTLIQAVGPELAGLHAHRTLETATQVLNKSFTLWPGIEDGRKKEIYQLKDRLAAGEPIADLFPLLQGLSKSNLFENGLIAAQVMKLTYSHLQQAIGKQWADGQQPRSFKALIDLMNREDTLQFMTFDPDFMSKYPLYREQNCLATLKAIPTITALRERSKTLIGRTVTVPCGCPGETAQKALKTHDEAWEYVKTVRTGAPSLEDPAFYKLASIPLDTIQIVERDPSVTPPPASLQRDTDLTADQALALSWTLLKEDFYSSARIHNAGTFSPEAYRYFNAEFLATARPGSEVKPIIKTQSTE